MNVISINCIVCGREHIISKSNPDTKCCSRGCANTWRASRIPRPSCAACGRLVNRRFSHCRATVYCSKKCEGLGRSLRTTKQCLICSTDFTVTPSKAAAKYCSRKCMGLGSRTALALRKPYFRSLPERAICLFLSNNFPDLQIISNDRTQLEGFEIDIYLPQLHCGIEYNGQHHFKPVYGEAQFIKTQTQDRSKRAIAARKGIKIHDINVMYSMSRTSKAKINQICLQACRLLGLVPTKQPQLTCSELATV